MLMDFKSCVHGLAGKYFQVFIWAEQPDISELENIKVVHQRSAREGVKTSVMNRGRSYLCICFV